MYTGCWACRAGLLVYANFAGRVSLAHRHGCRSNHVKFAPSGKHGSTSMRLMIVTVHLPGDAKFTGFELGLVHMN